MEVAARGEGEEGGGDVSVLQPPLAFISLWGFVKAITLLPSRKRN